MNYNLRNKNKKTILSLGAESQGNFSFLENNKLFFSDDFGDLQDEKNFSKFKKEISKHLEKIQPDIILTDLHPLFNTSKLGEELSKKYKSKLISVQHHHAHIAGAYGEQFLNSKQKFISTNFIGIAMDGTGYGLNEKIWGGEIFKIQKNKIKRIGHLENQTLLGADLAIKKPARMLISILNNFLPKEKIYSQIKKYYNKNEFELLYNQLQEKFNCLQTSSTGRILDAVSILLGFSENNRNKKHDAIINLENNSTIPFKLKPKIKNNIILTTPLFQYLITNIKKDKNKLAATSQLYLAQSFYEIAKKYNFPIYFAGGIANNKIISSFLESHGAITNKKIPRGDAGISFGQICFYLLTNSRN